MASANESPNAERPLRPSWQAASAAPQLQTHCSACQGRIFSNDRGEVLFCADCMARAYEDVASNELGGSD